MIANKELHKNHFSFGSSGPQELLNNKNWRPETEKQKRMRRSFRVVAFCSSTSLYTNALLHIYPPRRDQGNRRVCLGPFFYFFQHYPAAATTLLYAIERATSSYLLDTFVASSTVLSFFSLHFLDFHLSNKKG